MLRLLIFTIIVLCGHCSEEPLEGNGRVVGGYEAKKHAWPSQISLQYSQGSSWYHTCGGTLVQQNWVMTAAHCVDSNLNFRVVLGDHNIYQYEGTEQVIGVARIFVHANWNRNDLAAGYDIALLKLSQSANLNSYVQLGALPPSGQILPNDYPCYITGWGRTKTNGQLASVLQEAYLPVVDYAICSSSSYWGSTVKQTMVCAGGDGTRAGCQGDSGGPLNCMVNGKFYVHGITSFVSSAGCNVLRKPTVFTRVSAYISWINTRAQKSFYELPPNMKALNNFQKLNELERRTSIKAECHTAQYLLINYCDVCGHK